MRAGVPLTNLASSWAAFTVHAALHLRVGGRLGLVLPAELLTVVRDKATRDRLTAAFKMVSEGSKISGDKIHEIEAMGFTLPLYSKNGWSPFLR